MAMNLKAINKSNELFEGLTDREYLINPVSKADSNIVRELREILKKLDCTGVTAILDDYKFHKDQDIEEALLDYNTNFKEKEGKEDISEKDLKESDLGIFVRDFIDFEECVLELRYIHDFSKDEIWDYDKDRNLYYIIINKGGSEDTKKPMFSNKKFLFYSRVERDNKFNILKEYFGSNPLINII